MNKTENEIIKTIEKVGKAADSCDDVIFIINKDSKYGSMLRGDAANIAEALFGCMHKPDSAIGPHLFRMLKLTVLGLLTNPSPYGMELRNAIEDVFESENESDEDDEQV